MACFVFAQCLLAAVQGRPSAPPPARRRDQVRPPAVCRAPWRGAVTPDGRTACCSPSRQRRRKKKGNDVASVRSVPSPCPVYIGWLFLFAVVALPGQNSRVVVVRCSRENCSLSLWSLDSSVLPPAPASLRTLARCRSNTASAILYGCTAA